MNECGCILKRFKEVNINDAPTITKYLKLASYEESNLNIITMMIWKDLYPLYEYHEDDFMILLIKYHDEYFVYMPLCKKEVIIDKIKKAKYLLDECHVKYSFTCYIEEIKDIIINEFKDANYYEIRDSFDYIYDLKILSSFKGKKLQKKRNHLNNFYKLYQDSYQYEDIDETNINELIDYISNQEITDENLEYERQGIIRILKNGDKIAFKAAIIRINSKIEAYIITSRLSDNMLQENVEKTNKAFIGLNQALIYEFFKHNNLEYKWLNREDDMGVDNLRKSKLSYNPEYLIKKYCIKL